MYNQVLTVLVAITPIFLIVIVGLILRNRKWVKSETDNGLTTLMINVLIPCFIMDNILGSKAASDLPNVLTLASLGAGIIMLSIAIVYLMTPLLGMAKGSGKRSFTIATSIQNYGFMAIPLIMYMYDDKELLATLFLHNLGAEIAIFSIGVMVFSGKLSLHPKVFFKAPVLAVIFGVILNMTISLESIPAPLLLSIHMIGATAVPLALIAIGMTIADALTETKFSLKVSLSAIAFRIILLPAVILAIAYILPVDTDIKRILLMQSAMPAALFPIVLAKHYGGIPSLVAEVIITTSLVSFITMPLIVTFGGYLLGV